MNSKKIVSELMSLRGHTMKTLAEKLGFGTHSGVSERLRGSTEMRGDTLVKFLSAMDCELVVRSKLTDKTEWTVSIDTDNNK